MFSKQNQNNKELSYLKYIEPIIEIIIKDIIDSRIKNNPEKDKLLIQYQTSKNKLIDLIQLKKNNKENSHIFEFNIYILFKRGSISFIVEHWKFKIDTTPSVSNDLNENRIKRKLMTFYRSIKSLETILPLNFMIKKNFDYSFSAQLYLHSNIEINLEEKIKTEKKTIVIDANDEKYSSIQLTLNYLTNTGILTHEENIKEYINKDYFNELYTKLNLDKKIEQKNNYVPNSMEDTNIDIYSNEKDKEKVNNNNINDNDEDEDIDFSRKFDILEEKELLLSSVIQSTIIDKKGNLKNSDINKAISKERIDLDQLYESCFKNIEDINCQKSLDEILDKDYLMKKENEKLNEVKNKYELHLGQNKLLVDEIYEEMNYFKFNDLIIDHPKIENNEKKIIISNYFDNMDDNQNDKKEENKNEQELFKDIISDYIDIKQLICKN